MKKVGRQSPRGSVRSRTGKVLAPSFTGLRPASSSSSYSKQKNRASDTAHEVMLRQALWRLGLRYRKNVKSLPGKPDIVFFRNKVAIFCDGDFWHGREWPKLRVKLKQGSNSNYWVQKIRSNIERDRRNQALLEKNGWTVIRLWESDIKRSPEINAASVKKRLEILSRRFFSISVNATASR
jgi:DNA mismatch endonuclease, patch repair protein